MATLRFTDPSHWEAIDAHLHGGARERFAFALTRVVYDGPDGPVLRVEGVELIRDDEVEASGDGWTITDHALDRVHNRAIRERRGLVEFHDHLLGPPGFSPTDELSLQPMAEYVVELLEGRPYAATVYVGGRLHAEWFGLSNGSLQRGVFRSVTAVGEQLVSLNGPDRAPEERFDRQIPILGKAGQRAVRSMRVAVVGAGGTGSQAILALAYLGVRDFVLLDDDVVDVTNLNRVVTADLADPGSPKVIVARRRVLTLNTDAEVRILSGITSTGDHSELMEADLIVGCVDDDGPRHRLNELAILAGVPYIDIATGVDTNVDPPATGGRVRYFLPGRPCMGCTEELDWLEVARWYKPEEQRQLDRNHEYGLPEKSPSVVHLNGLAVNAAVAEIVAWVSGARPPALRLDIDLAGDPARPGVRIMPSTDSARRPGCVECGWGGETLDLTTR